MSSAAPNSIEWLDKLLLRHDAKHSLYSVVTEQTFEDIFSEPLQNLLPPELVRKIYSYHGKRETMKGIWKDIKSSPTLLGYLWFGFTSFQNSWMISFRSPREHATNGQSIQWQIISVHKMTPNSKRVLCLNFELASEPKKITIENDTSHSFHGLLVLYQKNKIKWGREQRAVEIGQARQLLVDLHFDLMPLVTINRRTHYFAH
jgi:hypothetical protein